MAEGLDENAFLQPSQDVLGPIFAQKYDVAIEPRNGRGMVRKSAQRQIKQTLLLPQHSSALQSNDDVRVVFL